MRGTNLPDAVGAQYQPGAIVREEAFTSTSVREPFPDRYQFTYENTSTGRFIEKYSAIPTEGEVLFRPGTRFRVLSRFESADGTIHIRAAEVAP